MRRAFLNRVNQMIIEENDTTFFTVDIGMWAIHEALRYYPDRCMNVGIYEDAMISIAAGMAKRGLIPTVFGIQPYLIDRTLEQIKMDLAYQNLGINIIGTGAAVDYSKYGYSHYCPEDVALIKQIPGCQFIAPGSAKQFLQLFNSVYRNGKTSFFRISDHPITEYDVDVEFGKANVIQEGSRATVIAVSVMLDKVMDACKDKDVTVLYYTTLEPFDKETLSKYYCNGKVLVCEPEYKGTFADDILDAYSGKSIQLEHVALPREIFRNYGSYEEKMQYYGLTRENITNKLNALID